MPTDRLPNPSRLRRTAAAVWLAVCLTAAVAVWPEAPSIREAATNSSASTVDTPPLAETVPTLPTATVDGSPKPDDRFRAIADIRVGQRVATADVSDATAWPTAVDSTWRLLTLEAVARWPDGTVDDWHVRTLQPPEWLAEHDVRVGHSVPAPLDLREMGADKVELEFVVTAVGPCPPIESGPGRVVLTTVNHLNAARVDVRVRSAGGFDTINTIDTIETTAPHKFLRLPRSMLDGDGPSSAALPAGVEDMDRHPDWWAAGGDLQPGDRLHTPSGWSEVVSVKPRTSVDRVYNLTVEHDHLFRVGPDAVLVHNNGCNIERFDGPKPKYHVNDLHAGRLRQGKTPLPDDAEAVFRNAVPDSATRPKAWFGINSKGKIYRFSSANDGTAHFSGIDGVGDGIRNITPYAKRRLEALSTGIGSP